MRKEIGIILVIILIISIAISLAKNSYFPLKTSNIKMSSYDARYITEGLETDTSKASIDLSYVLNGGPGKDGIPAINNPKYIDISEEETQESLQESTLGVVVNIGEQAIFFPYTILYWHEIVNDTIGGQNISVTFCPLCGSAIVFDRQVDNEVLEFGVSGKLYQSNLLMYDNKTHSLWSQSLGKAVIGEYTGKQLSLIDSNMMQYSEFKKNFQDGKVLSENTGFRRNYGESPYSGYETNDELYFPIYNSDDRLEKKELLYVVPYKSESYAFVRSDLKNTKKLEYKIGDEIVVITFNNGIITANIGEKTLPGYTEMFFSWATQHPENQNLWYIK